MNITVEPMGQSTKQQANFFISSTVLSLMKKHVPKRQQSAFVEHAIQRELQHERLLEALDHFAGVWKKEDHPASTEKFIRDLRSSKRP